MNFLSESDMHQEANADADKPSRTAKKPFLRKGSRKEPSALNRSPSPAKASPPTTDNELKSAQRRAPQHRSMNDELDDTLGDDTQSVLAVRAQYQKRQLIEQQELSEFEQLELELRRDSADEVIALHHSSRIHVPAEQPIGRPQQYSNDEYEDHRSPMKPNYRHQPKEEIEDWRTALNAMHTEVARLGLDDSPALNADSSHFYGDWDTPEIATTIPAGEKPRMSTATIKGSMQYQLPHQQHQYESDDDIVAYNNTNTIYNADDDDDAAVYSDNDEEDYSENESPLKPSAVNLSKSAAVASSRVNDSQSWGTVTRPAVRPAPVHGSTINSAITQQAIEEEKSFKPKPQLASSVKSRVVRPLSGNRGGRKLAVNSSTKPKQDTSAIVTGDIAAKARELETELEHYKKETSALRQARKQQEAALADVQKQKAELHEWVQAEKAAAEKWCADLRSAAAKERKAAALKHMREMSQRSALGSESSRKERAEIEALQATIEKLKINHDQSERKLKATVLRLQNLTRDQSNQITDLQAQIVSLEAEKNALQSGNMQQPTNSRKAKTNSYKTQSYAEEVSLDEADMTTDITYINNIKVAAPCSSNSNNLSSRNSNSYDVSENESDANDEDECVSNGVEEEDEHAYLSAAKEEAPSYHAERYQTMTSTGSSSAQRSSSAAAPRLQFADSSHPAPIDASSKSAEREESIDTDGTRITRYRNGTVKLVRVNGDTEVRFVNGDVKFRSAAEDGATKYYYASAQTTHTSFSDGREVYEFPNKQRETHFKNGKKEILFPDGTHKTVHPDGVQESVFPDGIKVIEYPNGEKKIVPPARR